MLINFMGCMGLGKTTLVEAIKEKYGYDIIRERFEDNPYWRDAYNGLSPEFLKMQISFMNQYIENKIETENKDCIVLDQQFYSGICFLNTQHYYGQINDKDAKTFIIRFNLLNQLLKLDEQYTNIVLHDEPENILKKVQKRNRPEEAWVDLEYVTKLNSEFVKMGNRNGFQLVNVNSLNEGCIPSEIERMIENYGQVCVA